jgi:DNA-binding MarR family transcriptional regulator
MVVAMPNIFDVFADEDTRSIFESLIKTKRADLRTIRGSLSMSEDKATAALERLGNAGLVEKVDGPFPDFDVYFLSAKGLAASRQLNASRLSKAL